MFGGVRLGRPDQSTNGAPERQISLSATFRSESEMVARVVVAAEFAKKVRTIDPSRPYSCDDC